MALSAAEVAWLRRHVGDTPPLADLEAIYTRTQSLKLTALEVTDTLLANLLSAPATFSVPDYSQSTGENIRGLQAKKAELEALPNNVDSSSVSAVVIWQPAGGSTR